MGQMNLLRRPILTNFIRFIYLCGSRKVNVIIVTHWEKKNRKNSYKTFVKRRIYELELLTCLLKRVNRFIYE